MLVDVLNLKQKNVKYEKYEKQMAESWISKYWMKMNIKNFDISTQYSLITRDDGTDFV